MSLSRKDILGHKDTRVGSIEVEEMGGTIHVASLTVAEADKIRSLGEGEVPAVVGLVVLGACDEGGARLFTDKDCAALGKLPASALGKVANAVLAHNGLSGESTEASGDEVKNG